MPDGGRGEQPVMYLESHPSGIVRVSVNPCHNLDKLLQLYVRSTTIIITILFAFPSAFGGSELFSYKYVINKAFLWTETKSWSKKTQKKKNESSSHLDRKSFVKMGFIKLKRFRFKLRMTFYCESHKRKPTAFVAQYPKSRLDFLCFDRLLPLFATPPPTLSKN